MSVGMSLVVAATLASPLTAVLALITVAVVLVMGTREDRSQGQPRFRLWRGEDRQRRALAEAKRRARDGSEGESEDGSLVGLKRRRFRFTDPGDSRVGVLLMVLIAAAWFVYLCPFPINLIATAMLFGSIALGRWATRSRHKRPGEDDETTR